MKLQTAISSRRAKRRDRLLAREWNKLRRFLQDSQDKQAARALLDARGSRPWAESMVHQIAEVHGDYLTCRRVWRKDGMGEDTLGVEDVFVARPRLIRRSLTTRDGVTFVYTDDQTLTASKPGETDETWLVTPKYIVGDRIEVEIIRGLTGVAEVDAQRGRPVDKNLDGRAWAALPS